MRTIWFAHWLRALSVLLVVAAHLGVNFWARNPETASLAHVRPLPDTMLERASDLVTAHDSLHAAWPTVAVGFFFLISGFVIPLTMDGRSVGRFLLNRFCRIYPVWTASLLMIAALFALEQWLADVPMDISAATWISNLATVPDLAYQPTLNPPGWTLFVEVKWYLFCAIAMTTFGLTNAWLIGGCALALALYAAVAWHGFVGLAAASQPAWVVTQTLAWDAPHLCMILTGVCFYNRLRNGWGAGRTWVCVGACLAAMTVSSWAVDDGGPHRGAKFFGYVLAAGVFALAFAWRQRFRPNRFVEYVANFSFSLYVVHFVLGMVLIDAFVRMTDWPLVSTLVGGAAVVAVSAAVHRYIEVPGIRFGKRWRATPVKTSAG